MPALVYLRFEKMILLSVFTAGLLVLSSCGPQPETSTTPASGTFGSVYASFRSNNCIDCHSPGGAAYANNGVQLDFSTQANAYTTLIAKNVTGATSASICAGVKIVASANPSNSYLEAVLNQSYYRTNFAGVSGCTPYNVHLQDTHLTTSELTSLTSWIQSGAANN